VVAVHEGGVGAVGDEAEGSVRANRGDTLGSEPVVTADGVVRVDDAVHGLDVGAAPTALGVSVGGTDDVDDGAEVPEDRSRVFRVIAERAAPWWRTYRDAALPDEPDAEPAITETLATGIGADPDTLHRLLRLVQGHGSPIIDQLEPTVTGYADGDP
jgi:hypothetical protein